MTIISGKFAHQRQDREEVSESACAEKSVGKSLVCFAPVLLYSSRRVTVAFAYGPWCTTSVNGIAALLRILAGCATRGGRIPAVVFD
jgi:hypothetical protein